MQIRHRYPITQYQTDDCPKVKFSSIVLAQYNLSAYLESFKEAKEIYLEEINKKEINIEKVNEKLKSLKTCISITYQFFYYFPTFYSQNSATLDETDFKAIANVVKHSIRFEHELSDLSVRCAKSANSDFRLISLYAYLENLGKYYSQRYHEAYDNKYNRVINIAKALEATFGHPNSSHTASVKILQQLSNRSNCTEEIRFAAMNSLYAQIYHEILGKNCILASLLMEGLQKSSVRQPASDYQFLQYCLHNKITLTNNWLIFLNNRITQSGESPQENQLNPNA